MIIKHNTSKFSYVRRVMALPLLLILFCAFALKTSRQPGTKGIIGKDATLPVVQANDKADIDFITDKQNEKRISVTHSTNQQKTETDTVPASEISKIKPQDIQSMNVTKEVIIIKLKNGDSVITRTKDYEALNPKNKKDTSSDYDVTFTKLEEEATYPGEPVDGLLIWLKISSFPKKQSIKRSREMLLYNLL